VTLYTIIYYYYYRRRRRRRLRRSAGAAGEPFRFNSVSGLRRRR